jgi:SAM-dependent methyltransferase
VGAGAGSYEPDGIRVVPVEPSLEMISQRVARVDVVRAVGERLPFLDGSFDAVMTLLSLHHWNDIAAGLAELRRIAPRRVVFTFDPAREDGFWLVGDYLPEAVFEWPEAFSIDAIVDGLGGGEVEVVAVPWDCTDGFQAAYWRRPERYLDPSVRRSISTFARIDEVAVDRAMRRLAADLESGAWAERHADLLTRSEVDYGYRLIVSTE